MYWVYVLENSKDKSWYIGFTSDLDKRVYEHQSGYGAETTRSRNGWMLVYCEGYKHRKDAQGRERFLKSGSGRKFLQYQLRNHLDEK